MRHLATIRVLARSTAASRGVLAAGHLRMACALGRSGRRAGKREGDGATPCGRLVILEVYWRPDRVRRPKVPCPIKPIVPDLGWCDAPDDRNYNRPVRLPYPASAETMWRQDHLYDIVVVLDHNVQRRARGRGSAIFMHVARPGLSPTEGCVALPLPALKRLLATLRPGARLHVGP